MLQEMKLEDAIKNYLKGRKVLALTDLSIDKDHQDYELEPLEDVLARMRYLVDVPAVENPDFKETMGQMEIPEKMIPPPRAYPGRNRGSAYGNRKKLGTGAKRVFRILAYPL